MSGNNHLSRRNGVYYYRRRVPAQLIKPIGSKVIQFSLGTTSLKEAKQLRTAKDLEWDVRFEACTKSLPLRRRFCRISIIRKSTAIVRTGNDPACPRVCRTHG